ncbi:MAG: cytochrome c-type biogenesis protein CcmH [Proteobacteria bacterium]|nr:cytochrome c-type biogenesis protein CcmH [Pseudomonadota bacterium]
MILLWTALALAQPTVPADAPVEAPVTTAPAAVEPPAEVIDTTLPAEFGPPGPPISGAELDARGKETSLLLRCPSCQGLSVYDSPATSARTMKRRIYDLLAAGYSQEQVEAYFVSRYGEWVLLQPKAHGLTWALWVVPGVGFGGVFAWALAVGLRWREEEAIEGPTQEHLLPHDAFEQRILEEIE